jgi:hypothetical protein
MDGGGGGVVGAGFELGVAAVQSRALPLSHFIFVLFFTVWIHIDFNTRIYICSTIHRAKSNEIILTLTLTAFFCLSVSRQ